MSVSCEYWLTIDIIIPITCSATIDMGRNAFPRIYLVNSVQLRVIRFQVNWNLVWFIFCLEFGGGIGRGGKKSQSLSSGGKPEVGICLFLLKCIIITIIIQTSAIFNYVVMNIIPFMNLKKWAESLVSDHFSSPRRIWSLNPEASNPNP